MVIILNKKVKKEINLSVLLYKNNNIDWILSCNNNIKVPFKYEEYEGVLKLYKKDGRDIYFYYNDILYNTSVDSFKNCNLGKIFNSKSYDYIYKKKDIIELKNSKFLVNELKYIKDKNNKKYRAYNVTCLKCGYTFDLLEKDLKKRKGCICEGHSKVVKGINDLWTTHPEIAKLLKNPEDGYIVSFGSSKKLDWICQKCNGIIKNKEVYSVYKYGLSCSKCSDGISYPNKFTYNVLIQVEKDFETEKKFKWCKFKKFNSEKYSYGIYDFVIENKKLIIEIDGGLGHGKNIIKNSEVSLEETIYRDEVKDKLAFENGYKVIRINMDYHYNEYEEKCKEAIVNSDLKNIYDLSNIDWDIANKNTLESLAIKSCDLWNLGYSTSSISKELHITIATVERYLKKCSKLKLCSYSPELGIKRKSTVLSKYAGKDDTDEKIKFVCEYYNLNKNNMNTVEISKQLGVSRSLICKYLREGREKGWCDYYSKYDGTKPSQENYRNVKRKFGIELIYKNQKYYFRTFKLLRDFLLEKYNISTNEDDLSDLINGKRDSYKGIILNKISKKEFNKKIEEFPENVFGKPYTHLY